MTVILKCSMTEEKTFWTHRIIISLWKEHVSCPFPELTYLPLETAPRTRWFGCDWTLEERDWKGSREESMIIIPKWFMTEEKNAESDYPQDHQNHNKPIKNMSVVHFPNWHTYRRLARAFRDFVDDTVTVHWRNEIATFRTTGESLYPVNSSDTLKFLEKEENKTLIIIYNINIDSDSCLHEVGKIGPLIVVEWWERNLDWALETSRDSFASCHHDLCLINNVSNRKSCKGWWERLYVS